MVRLRGKNARPELGRFFNQDRFADKYLSLTPYQYGANNPIKNIDVNGDTIWVVIRANDANGNLQESKYYWSHDKNYEGWHDDKGNQATSQNDYMKDVNGALARLHLGKEGADVIDYLAGSTNNTEIAKPTGSQENSEWAGSGLGNNFVLWNPSTAKSGISEDGSSNRPSFIGLGHELAHKYDRWKGTMNNGTWYTSTDPNGNPISVQNAELYATYRENQMRAEQGIPLRTHYSPDETGSPYEPSRIIRSGTAQSIYFDANGNTNFKTLNKGQIPYTYKRN